MGYCQGIFFNLFWKLKTFCWTYNLNKTFKQTQQQQKQNSEMGGCRCIFRDCHINSSSCPGMHFFHFPIKQKDKLNLWIKYAQAQHILNLTPNQMKNKVVCNTHFRDECFMNYKKDRLTREAIPTLIRLNKQNLVLDYELSDNPEPTKLPITTAKHLLKPTLTTTAAASYIEIDENEKIEEMFIESMENNDDIINDNICLKSSISSVENNDDEIQENYFSIIGLDKELEDENIKELSIKVLNKSAETDEQQQQPPPFKKLKTFSAAPVILNRNASPTINKINTVIKSKSNSPNTKRKTILLNGTKTTTKLYKNQKRTLQKYNNNNMKKIDIIKPIDDIEPTIINMEDIENSQTPPPVFIDKEIIENNNNEKIINELLDKQKLEYENQIQELQNKLKAKDDEIIKVTQIETVSTSKQNVQTSPVQIIQPKPLTKGQLFNSIKKYLCPSMSALVRMEMFSEPERDWKYDEKQAAIELLQLGDHVFDYFRDEWRFRLPPKKNVEQWMSANSNIDDDEDL